MKLKDDLKMTETETKNPELKTFNWEEIKGHKDSKSSWVVIYDRIYDVTKFLEEVIIFLFHRYHL